MATIRRNVPIMLSAFMSTWNDEHAFVLRGYTVANLPGQIISSTLYSIWNPWNPFFESMDANNRQFISHGVVFEWTSTVIGHR